MAHGLPACHKPVMLLRATALCFLLAACSSPEPERAERGPAPAVRVADAVCRPNPPGRRMALCYLALTSTTADALIAAESSRAARVALHDVPVENGMTVLTPRSGPLGLPGGETVRLRPGGTALALQGVERPLRPGETVPLTLRFNAAPPVETVARVAADPAA